MSHIRNVIKKEVDESVLQLIIQVPHSNFNDNAACPMSSWTLTPQKAMFSGSQCYCCIETPANNFGLHHAAHELSKWGGGGRGGWY
jgi:hypothetical protein